uniref:Uncharacterized protein n=1 Tax=uncultured bacterium A1Q1_fos_75 TaxID=1256589 RepID=L7VQM5_9BACT|nr:hypothetical protein [uncultured bacterium A1Q1_fos_75]
MKLRIILARGLSRKRVREHKDRLQRTIQLRRGNLHACMRLPSIVCRARLHGSVPSSPLVGFSLEPKSRGTSFRGETRAD